MNFWKFKFYLDILSICGTVATTYCDIVSPMLGDMQYETFGIIVAAFGWWGLWHHNEVAHELWYKWKGGGKR